MNEKLRPKFLVSTYCSEKRKIYFKSDSSIIMIGYGTDEIIQERFDLLLHKYQVRMEKSMKGSHFLFDYVSGMHYMCNKISLNCGESYIDFLNESKARKHQCCH